MRSARWSVPNAMLAGVLALALCSGGTVFGGGVFSVSYTHLTLPTNSLV